MANNKNVMWKNAMTHGAILGAVLVVYSVILYVLDVNVYNPKGSAKYWSYLNYLLIAVGLFIAQKNYRDSVLSGVITYSKSLGYGVWVGVFASVITTFYSVIFIKFIDPGVMEYIFDITEQQMIDKGLAEAEITKAMEMTRKVTFPMMIIGGLITYAFISFVLSLITSIFVKKEGDPFTNDMKEIEEV